MKQGALEDHRSAVGTIRRMQVESLRDLIQRRPFEPFQLHLSDGRVFTVPHPDFIGLVAARRLIVVVPKELGEAQFLDALHAVSAGPVGPNQKHAA